MWRGHRPLHLDRRMPGLVRRYRRLAGGAFRVELKAFDAEAAEARDVEALRQATETAMRLARPTWLAYYRRCIVDVGATFARQGLPQEARTAYGTANDPWWVTTYQQRLGPEEWWSPWLAGMLRYAEKTAAQRVQHIDDGTRTALNITLREGIAEGVSVPDLRDRIHAQYADFSKVRAERIARTEVLNSARAGAHESVVATGLADIVVKSWLHSGDDRVRSTHEEAQAANERIPFNDTFKVRSMRTGAIQELQFPGDSSLGADASNIINCRCGSVHDVAEGQR